MINVCILQTDNRPNLDYLQRTKEVNIMFCEVLHYHYVFAEMDNNTYTEMHPATRKIHMVDFFLKKTAYDVFVFLDSDAWVQNGKWLHEIIKNLMQDENKHGCFSRDPYVKKNTFINSGSFILKKDRKSVV